MTKNDFAVNPPKGWNSYDNFDTAVTEAEVKANALFMHEHLQKYGYEYVVVDIEWYSNDAATRRRQYQYIPFGDDEMDEYGRFIPSPKRFPSSAGGNGFKPLADFCHELGLKFGIHIMRGIPRAAAEKHLPVLGTNQTAADVADPSSICIWNPDMYGVRDSAAGAAYYDSIIQMYAGWGVDFIKCDDICDSRLYRVEEFSGWHEIKMLHSSIMKTGRPIVLSLSPGPAQLERSFLYSDNANMWRIMDDFWDKWELLKAMFPLCEKWQDHVKKGCYPDCDMLPLGQLGTAFGNPHRSDFSKDEAETMMTLWCMFRSPLMIGGALTDMSDDELSLLTNERLLDYSTDGWCGRQVMRDDSMAIWRTTNQTAGRAAFALFNLSDKKQDFTVDLAGIFEDTIFQRSIETDKNLRLISIWEDALTEVTCGAKISLSVPEHGVQAFEFV